MRSNKYHCLLKAIVTIYTLETTDCFYRLCMAAIKESASDKKVLSKCDGKQLEMV